ncbi:MAG: YggS family pyridoxal phosphate-dependent enzyme [Planctomycetota bacterium]
MPKELFRIDQLDIPHATAKQRVADNWRAVVDDVARSAQRHGRQPDSIRIVGVTKYVDEVITSWLVESGCHDLGENRPQVLMQKWQAFQNETSWPIESTRSICWHQIGHLQRNKVKKLLDASPTIHSIDSMRLLEEIIHQANQSAPIGLSSERDEDSEPTEPSISVLVEVNVSGEAAKTGLPPEQLDGLLERFQITHSIGQTQSNCSVALVGLMAMAGWGTDAAEAQRQFDRLRSIRDDATRKRGITLPELSMGMSGDFDAAIAAGSTMVRIGSRLFEGLIR